MHFKASTVLALAAAASVAAQQLFPRQQSEIDIAGDLPDQCQDDQDCLDFINTAATCDRDLSVPFPQDDDYLDCICEDKDLLKSCYKDCVSQYKREGDIKRANQLCHTNRRGGRGRGRGRHGSRYGDRYGQSRPEDWQDQYDDGYYGGGRGRD